MKTHAPLDALEKASPQHVITQHSATVTISVAPLLAATYRAVLLVSARVEQTACRSVICRSWPERCTAPTRRPSDTTWTRVSKHRQAVITSSRATIGAPPVRRPHSLACLVAAFSGWPEIRAVSTSSGSAERTCSARRRCWY